MKTVFPLDEYKLREFYRGKIAAVLNVETQPQHAGDSASLEIDSMPKKLPVTPAAYKLHKKLESLQ
jgi:hypothetical protein